MSLGTNYTFYPTVRRGYRPDDTYARNASVPGSPTVGVDLTVRGSGTDTDTKSASVDLRLYGAGDVIGLDNRQVVRTEPEADTTSFLPNYFPLVEFDRPDLPWLFSPHSADQHGRNSPWLCLVAVKSDLDAVTFTPAGLGPLPVLEAPTPELPPPDQAWAWAHVQVAGSQPTDRSELFGAASNRTVSRLVCPRNLEGNTRYRACVVPTFERGRLAGLGRDPADASRPLAWDPSADESVRLPVYHHWTFSTSAEGDFESLVRELDPVDLGPDVGYRTIDVSNPGPEDLKLPYADVDDGDKGTVGMGGALRSADPVSDPYENVPKLRELLNKPADVVAETDFGAVGPPLYGTWHAGAPQLSEMPAGWDEDDPMSEYYPRWFNTLNPDPRYRIASGLGARVIREHQDELMASAWEQFGDLNIANDWMQRAQLARDAMQNRHDAMADSGDGEVLTFTAPIHDDIATAEVVAGQNQTLKSVLEDSDVPTELTTASFRRITRSRGDLVRRRDVQVSQSDIATAVEQGTAPKLQPASFKFTTDAQTAADGGKWTEPDEETTTSNDTATWQGLTLAATDADEQAAIDTELTDRMQQRLQTDDIDVGDDGDGNGGDDGPWDDLDARPRGTLDAITESTLDDLDPAFKTPQHIADVLSVDLDRLLAEGRDDPVEEVMAHPTYTQPMYKALVDLDQRYLLPGVGNVPKNSVSAVVTNPKFIESFMVGLNHEMARELRWRRFPTDRRGTYFRWFWKRPSSGPGPPPPDIEKIHDWNVHKLGNNSPGDTDTAKVVVLVRGELLRRYPNTLIYATKAVEDGNDRVPYTLSKKDEVIDTSDAKDDPDIMFPVFRGTLDPDVTFLGFELSPEEAVNDPYHKDTTDPPDDHLDEGWFFVFEEPPGAEETRFGLDINDADIDSIPLGITYDDNGTTKTNQGNDEGAEHGWAALSWGHLAPGNASEVDQGAYVDIDSRPGQENWRVEANTSWVTSPDNDDYFEAHEAAEWGKNSAHMARITFQQPVRVAIHADDLLPDPGGDGG